MKKEFNLEFCFKGNRKYVQGPDIFDAVINNLIKDFNNIKNIKYTAYEMLYTNASLIVTDKFIKNEYPTINSIITFMNDNTKYYAVVYTNQKNIECSNEYSEELVQKKSKINGNTIVFENVLNNSFTEITVSMNKYFLNQTIDVDGKWIVTKFDYENLADIMDIKKKKIQIKLLQNFNNKLTKSLLYLNHKEVGYLYFSLITEEA